MPIYVTGIPERLMALRGHIARIRDLRARYRRVAEDPAASAAARDDARAIWKAWERELGAQADEILAVLDALAAAAGVTQGGSPAHKPPVKAAALKTDQAAKVGAS